MIARHRTPREKELNCNVQPTGQLLNTGFHRLSLNNKTSYSANSKGHDTL